MEGRHAPECAAQLLLPGGQEPEPAHPGRAKASSVVDTTELRWFVPGPLPPDIGGWFAGSAGVSEERCDTYLLDGRADIGVKLRFRETLELKVRQSLGGRVELSEGLAGSLEVWRKWTPAEGLVEEATDGWRVDVHKSVVKRRFRVDGTEIAFSSDPHATDPGCDVEIAGVTVGAVQAWTFAFAAFGPPETRRDALLASWQALVADTPCPEPFVPRTGQAMSYPLWLTITVSPDPDEVAAAAIQHRDVADIDLRHGEAGCRSLDAGTSRGECSEMGSKSKKSDRSGAAKLKRNEYEVRWPPRVGGREASGERRKS